MYWLKLIEHFQHPYGVIQGRYLSLLATVNIFTFTRRLFISITYYNIFSVTSIQTSLFCSPFLFLLWVCHYQLQIPVGSKQSVKLSFCDLDPENTYNRTPTSGRPSRL